MASGVLAGLIRLAATAAAALVVTAFALQATGSMIAEAAANAPRPVSNPRPGYVATRIVAKPEALNIALATPARPTDGQHPAHGRQAGHGLGVAPGRQGDRMDGRADRLWISSPFR